MNERVCVFVRRVEDGNVQIFVTVFYGNSFHVKLYVFFRVVILFQRLL